MGRGWQSYVTLFVGLSGFVVTVTRWAITGEPAEPMILTASIAIIGLGLGMRLEK